MYSFVLFVPSIFFFDSIQKDTGTQISNMQLVIHNFFLSIINYTHGGNH